jgi:hypothetical protein
MNNKPLSKTAREKLRFNIAMKLAFNTCKLEKLYINCTNVYSNVVEVYRNKYSFLVEPSFRKIENAYCKYLADYFDSINEYNEGIKIYKEKEHKRQIIRNKIARLKTLPAIIESDNDAWKEKQERKGILSWNLKSFIQNGYKTTDLNASAIFSLYQSQIYHNYMLKYRYTGKNNAVVYFNDYIKLFNPWYSAFVLYGRYEAERLFSEKIQEIDTNIERNKKEKENEKERIKDFVEKRKKHDFEICVAEPTLKQSLKKCKEMYTIYKPSSGKKCSLKPILSQDGKDMIEQIKAHFHTKNSVNIKKSKVLTNNEVSKDNFIFGNNKVQVLSEKEIA